ncbi:hypothetical protein SASPL_106685 [Salvia splendens]|uniref:Uncharacterized protein n=1 Tax=Salvia splendens TaxID=180675 RepID=A0A8X8YMA9_SALSN|nr:hypothetical protein SASPL_106685 [Salvia splendens]
MYYPLVHYTLCALTLKIVALQERTACVRWPVPPKSIAGSSLAEICHSLVAKTYSSEDRGNAMKRGHDAAMNHNGKKRKRRGGKSKRNA